MLTATENTTCSEDFRASILPFLSPALRDPCSAALGGAVPGIEELRIRSGRPLMAVFGGADRFVTPAGALSTHPGDAFIPTRDHIDRSLQIMGQGSVYALEEELRQGFITLPGGHRVGLAGRMLLEGGHIVRMTDIASLNIRLARALPGLSDRLLPFVARDENIVPTLVVSPPRAGKTTLLRDLIRQISTGVQRMGLPGMKVGLVDERSEVAACFHGVPQLDVGPRTDVLDACPKADGLLLLIRSMSPQVVATDELGGQRDVEAVEELINAGATLVTTAHGRSVQDLRARPGLARLLEWGVFGRFVFLSRSRGAGTLERITDGEFREIFCGPLRLSPLSAGRDSQCEPSAPSW